MNDTNEYESDPYLYTWTKEIPLPRLTDEEVWFRAALEFCSIDKADKTLEAFKERFRKPDENKDDDDER